MRQEIRGGCFRMDDGLYINSEECDLFPFNNIEKEIAPSLPATQNDKVPNVSKSLGKSYLFEGFITNERTGSNTVKDASEETYVPAVDQHRETFCNDRIAREPIAANKCNLRVKLPRNQPVTTFFTFENDARKEVDERTGINVTLDSLDKFSNGNGCDSSSNKAKLNKFTKFQHISFDIPKRKKECVLISCPSLDSSLSNDHPIKPTASPSSPLPLPSFVDTGQSSSFHVAPPHLLPLTLATPSCGLSSQASLDSGVLSTLSLDMSQSNQNENWTKRRRTASSSVSSGTSEMWQSSLDGEGSALEAVSENLGNYVESQAVFNSRMKKSEGCESLNSCLYNISHFGNEPLEICAQTNAHHSNVDHSVLMPYQELDTYNSGSGTVKEKHKSTKVIDRLISKPTIKPIRYNLNADKYFSSNVASPQNGKREELLRERYSPEVLRKMEKYAANLVMLVLNEALSQSMSLGWSIKCSGQCNQELCREDYIKKTSSKDNRKKEIQTEGRSRFQSLGLSNCSSSLCWTPEIPFSPQHRPHSRASKRSSLSFSHDSLISGAHFQDDSHLITGAVSHDTLSFSTNVRSIETAKSCLVCLENEIYSLPIDNVKTYQGPILQPKVIIQQPKRRHPNHVYKSSRELDGTKGQTSKRRISGQKLKRINQMENQKSNNNVIEQNEHLTTGKSNSTQLHATAKEGLENEKISPDSSSKELLIADTAESRKDQTKEPGKRESESSENTKVCRIGLMPFASSKSQKRKEQSNAKVERKKGRSFSSNIRNTLITLFSFKRNQKEIGSCVNAKSEFIDASSQGFYESSDGLKWGKICPLPSAPPLRTSAKNSAFTDHISVSTLSNATPQTSNSKQNRSVAVDSRLSNNKDNNMSNLRQSSSSISPASLLSCLGHPRTNSIDDYDIRIRSTCEAISKCPPPSVSNRSSSVVTSRALPPLPSSLNEENVILNSGTLNINPSEKVDEGCDFASNIEKVKNYGWYWGPISGEAAEKVLSNEPDGSFIVRDSSDYHYIFSLTFRLNGVTSHVRIEHDQGNFSFGGFTRFKSQTIVDFIEKAVEHSRSGRYLFFLHRRPVLGPMRVQLLHPVSRFKHVQSLQHLCRFVIVQQVRKDLIPDLPLPQRLKDYLNSPHYYSEQVEQCMTSSSALSTDGDSPSPKSEHSTSPCSGLNTNGISSLRQFSLNRSVCPSSSGPIQATANSLFLNLRCSFPSSSGPADHNLRHCKSKNIRLASSHSSLDTSTLHAAAACGSAYPISMSTLSSESTSGRYSSFKCNSHQRKFRYLSASSYSSPSSPVPFDYSPPDWLSSSDDNLRKASVDSSLNSKKKSYLTTGLQVEQELSSNKITQQSIHMDNMTVPVGLITSDLVASASESVNVVSESALPSSYLDVCDNKPLCEKEISNDDCDDKFEKLDNLDS